MFHLRKGSVLCSMSPLLFQLQRRFLRLPFCLYLSFVSSLPPKGLNSSDSFLIMVSRHPQDISPAPPDDCNIDGSIKNLHLTASKNQTISHHRPRNDIQLSDRHAPSATAQGKPEPFLLPPSNLPVCCNTGLKQDQHGINYPTCFLHPIHLLPCCFHLYTLLQDLKQVAVIVRPQAQVGLVPAQVHRPRADGRHLEQCRVSRQQDPV